MVLSTIRPGMGSIKVADDNIRLDLLGMLNFNSELAGIILHLTWQRPICINFILTNQDTTASASMLLLQISKVTVLKIWPGK